MSRPGALPALPESHEPRRRRIPGWAKVAAVVAVVVLVALGNVAAKHREQQRERAAADRVEVTATMTSDVTEFGLQLVLLVHNDGRLVRLLDPHVDAAGFTLSREDTPFPVDLAAGRTQAIALRLGAPCRRGVLTGEAPAEARMVVPVVPSSGREHPIAVHFPAPLSVLGKRACAFLTAGGSIVPRVDDVVREPYAVSFRLTVQNDATQSIVLVDLAGPGVALSVEGGLPIDIGPLDDLIVRARLSIPRCSTLPNELDTTRVARPYAIGLAVLRKDGTRLTLPVRMQPGDPLLAAIRSLAHTICPRGPLPSG